MQTIVCQVQQTPSSPQDPTRQQHPEDGRAWWKYPIVWMVVAGPVAVIIASLITWILIMRSPNEVLTQFQDVEDQALVQQKGGQYTPANRARNHAATGGVAPEVEKDK